MWKTLENVLNKWIWDYVNSIETSGMRPQYRIFNCWVQIYNQIRTNSLNTQVIVFTFTTPKSLVFTEKQPPYWIRHLKLKSEFTTVFSDLKNLRVIVFRAIVAWKLKNLLNFKYVTAVLDMPFLYFIVWLQNRHHQSQKPPGKSCKVNYSKRIHNSLKYCMRDRHIRSAVLNCEILTSDS